ncbi:MAG TPA: PQQ-binding-like beta-propeller repeat protein [Anaerolineaceae bacterium]|nr:PQQ-binding-like beta-propeller repeat protein [Anaerolineaceae bacterium]
MTDHIRKLTCPSCGAPLKAAEEDRRIQCQYCHTMVDLPDSQEPIEEKPIVINLSDFQPREAPKRTATFLGVLIFALAVVPIGIILLLIGLDNSKKTISPGEIVYSVVNQVLISDEHTGATADMMGIAYTSDDSHRLVYLDFDQTPVIRWKSEDLGDESYRVQHFVQGDQVIVVEETHLRTLNRADGTLLWETSLSDKLSSACDNCLQADDEKIYVLTQIGILHTFDRLTGQQLWSAGLEETPDTILLFSSGPGVVDNLAGVPTVIIFDKENGQRLYTIQPVCPNRTFTSDPQEMALYSNIWTTADRNGFYVAYGFWEPGCLDKWSIESGERTWQAEVSEEITRSSSILQLSTPDTLYLAIENDGILWSVDLNSGEARQLATEENYYLRPLFAQDGILVVEAQRTRGSTRFEIWGLDGETGERKWQVIPTAEDSLDQEASSIMDSGGAFTVQNTSSGMALIQAFDDPERLTFDLIDLHTGVTQNQASYAMPETSIFTLEKIGWSGDTIWIYSDGTYAFNGGSGLREIKWP